MPTERAGVVPFRILVDLKPALDGFSGIPQETRLLFRSLRKLEGYDVEGLIQHGGRRLRLDDFPAGEGLSVSQHVNRLSRVVVSLYENPNGGIVDKVGRVLQRCLSLCLLRVQKLTGTPVKPGIFDSGLFNDFIWNALFHKTLDVVDKDLVTSARYRIFTPPRRLFHKAGLTRFKFSSTPRYVSIDTRGFDVLLAQTPFPGRVSPGTNLVVRYHDSVPILMAHTIKDKAFHQASHFYALQDNVRSGAWFSCISETTRADLLKIFPEAEPRTSVIHNFISPDYFVEDSNCRMVARIIRDRLSEMDEFDTDLSGLDRDGDDQMQQQLNFLLMVSTIEPRKNHLLLLEAWKRLKNTTMPNLKLVIVGSMGWHQEPIISAFRPWATQGGLFYLNCLPSADLRVLYKHAAATVCPSLSEGFGYSGVEAMRCGGIVISSDIPVHREIYGNASEYFNAYSAEDAAEVIDRVLGKDGAPIRERLREAGQLVSNRYSAENIVPKWHDLLQTLRKTGDI